MAAWPIRARDSPLPLQTSSTSPSWSPRTTRCIPIRVMRRSGCRSARPGTAGRRSRATFNEDHILATTQAICEYRAGPGHRRPAVPGRRHACARRAGAGQRARGARRQRRPGAGRLPRRIHADPGGVPGDPGPQRGRARARGPTGSSSRPRTTRRRTAASSTTRPTAGRPAPRSPADPGPGERTARRRADGRPPGAVRAAVAADTTGHVRFPRQYVAALAQRGRHGRDPGRRGPHRRRPARWGQRGLLGRDRRALRPRPHGGQPRGGPDLPVHDPGLGRQDPDGLLVAVRDGQPDPPPARVHRRDRERHRLRPARHRHARTAG